MKTSEKELLTKVHYKSLLARSFLGGFLTSFSREKNSKFRKVTDGAICDKKQYKQIFISSLVL